MSQPFMSRTMPEIWCFLHFVEWQYISAASMLRMEALMSLLNIIPLII